jgi:hypothetical protein
LKAKVDNEAFGESVPTIGEGKEVAEAFDGPALSFPIDALQNKPKTNVMDYISSGFFAAVEAVKNAGIIVKDKIEESKVGQRITSAASTAGHFIVDKTKMAATAVKEQGSKIVVGVAFTFRRVTP